MVRRTIALSFAGSGHLLCYQLGAAQALLNRSEWASRISAYAGASGGAIAATVCALLPDRVAEFAESVACKGYGFNGLSEALHGKAPRFVISDGDVRRVSEEQRLFLSVTHCRTGRNALLSRFASAAQLQRCVLASAAIPQSFHPLDMTRSRPTYPEAGGVIVDPACEWDPSAAKAAYALPVGQLPFSPHGEAYVDGGISNSAPVLERPAAVHTVTVSPISGPQGCLVAPTAASCGHYHLAPLDASPRVPFVAPALAGMRCFLSLDNLRAFQSSLSGRPATLTRWYERGVADAERFAAEHAPPET